MRPFFRSRNGFHRLGIRLLACLAVTLTASVARAGEDSDAFPAEYLAPAHPAWLDVETLWNLGGLGDLPLFTRPLARVDIAASLARTLRDRPDLAKTAPARRLVRELAFEWVWLEAADGARETRPLLEYQEGQTLFRIRTEVRGGWLLDDGQGEIVPGSIAALAVRTYLPGRTFVRAELGIERIVDDQPLGDSIVKGSDAYLSVRDAYLSFRTAPLDIVLGLGRNRWAEGGSGTLLLSDAAFPYPQILFGKTFGRHLRFVAVTAALHQPEQRWFSAHRLEVALGSHVRLGLHESAAYFSSSPDLLYVIGVIPYTLVQRNHDRTGGSAEGVVEHRNNVIVGADIAVRIANRIRFDGELLIDDLATESASQPNRIGYLLGTSWTGFLGGKTSEARAEYAKVYRYTYAVFYHANLIHDDVPLGYGRGPDVEHGEIRLERDFSTDLRLGVGLDWTRRGSTEVGDYWDPDDPQPRDSGATLTPVVTDRLLPHLRARVNWRDVLWLRAKVGALSVRNEGHVEGADRDSFFTELVLNGRW